MTTFRLILEYDGTEFEGWQRQATGHRTVQGTLEDALSDLTGVPVVCVGAGRTDAGVHAWAQVASTRLETGFDGETIARALNARLPVDIRVLSAEAVFEEFHALRDSRGKHYQYLIWNSPIASPLRRTRSVHVVETLDLEAMSAAADALEGTHDFKSFETTGSEPGSTIRTISRISVAGEPGGEIRIDVEGDGFLRHMVRNIVGTLIEVGAGRRSFEGMRDLVAARARSEAGPTAPSKGLTLVTVRY